ncbi:DUF1800 family protein [Cupriavidus sp. UME77]|uniref:DUF1800 domain-containing protein n=1 Tax=Cupriavidus sp. UME77 TaxID=1862321 RepID=UPI0015FFC65F|nr:DUF1800 domain-containing protein [Cupriavidus sp. UME77]MBB1634651.1 hypothetical protein [Cupriavidus sp. UME77]
MTNTAMTAAAVAVNRFGLGARPDEPLPADPRGWLLGQFEHYEARPAAWSAQPDTAALAGEFGAQQREVRQAQADAKTAARQQLQRETREAYRDAVDARVTSALVTQAPFVERLVHFWSNHFAVSVEKPAVAALAGAFEAEAIRPHVLGRFEDMLVAVERHPAMQVFLDQVRSIGPDSMAARVAAQRAPERQLGLNENLAREIMELHTLGVRSGYQQADVTEFARALTGWSIGGLGAREDGEPGRFQFRARVHEPGTRTILGRSYPQQGEAQALAVLHDLAQSEATANHLATKLVRHFVSDAPPPALVARLSQAYLRSGGALPEMYRALVQSPEAWASEPAKFKTPWEWTLSSLRGLGLREAGALHFAPMLTQLGQPVWRPGSPAGYDDIAASWAAPDALVRRVELAQRLAARVGDRIDARELGPKLLAGTLSAPTAAAIARAESAQTALALLLVSPDFQRR